MENSASSRSGMQGGVLTSHDSPLGGHGQLLSSQVVRYARGRFHHSIDAVALEAPLDIYLNGRQAGATMRTPGADPDLALGLLLTAGHVPCSVTFDSFEFQEKEDDILVRCPVAGRFPAPEPGIRQAQDVPLDELAGNLLDMRATLEEWQRLHRHTGATHCAMFFDRECAPLSFGEDVGRHNAFDKCVGNAVRQDGLERAHHAVVTSRLSNEIIRKAISARVRVLAGFSVATSMAVHLAREHNMILVGRLRDETMVIYG